MFEAGDASKWRKFHGQQTDTEIGDDERFEGVVLGKGTTLSVLFYFILSHLVDTNDVSQHHETGNKTLRANSRAHNRIRKALLQFECPPRELLQFGPHTYR